MWSVRWNLNCDPCPFDAVRPAIDFADRLPFKDMRGLDSGMGMTASAQAGRDFCKAQDRLVPSGKSSVPSGVRLMPC